LISLTNSTDGTTLTGVNDPISDIQRSLRSYAKLREATGSQTAKLPSSGANCDMCLLSRASHHETRHDRRPLLCCAFTLKKLGEYNGWVGKRFNFYLKTYFSYFN
jgi:hypothetical protein